MDLLYLIYGENEDLIKEKKDEIISSSGVDEFNISTFDMEESSIREALNDAQSIPFLSDYRIVVFKNAYFFSSSKDKKTLDENDEELKNFLTNYPDTTISLFLVPYETIDNKKTIVKLIKEKGNLIYCAPYTKEDITRYIDQTLKDSHHIYTTDARNEILERLDQDPLNFKNEMNKLLLYLKEDEKITIDIVKDLIIKDPEDNVFELLNAITSKNKKRAIEIYYDLLKCGNTSNAILGIIIRKFEEILYSKELIKNGCSQEEFMNSFKVSKGRAYFMMKNAKDMPYKTLNLWLNRMIKLDYEIKSGKKDPDSGVELLILKV